QRDDLFGHSVAIDGDTVVVGAHYGNTPAGRDAGAAYVFLRLGHTWIRQAKLLAPDGAQGDSFGSSVAIEGDTAVVAAAFGTTPTGERAGSAYAFVRSGGKWTEQAKLSPSDGVLGDQFGWAVAFSGETALVGAPFADLPSAQGAGAAYAFDRSGTAWSQAAKLIAPDASGGDQFGVAVGLLADAAVIGAPSKDTPAGPDAG